MKMPRGINRTESIRTAIVAAAEGRPADVQQAVSQSLKNFALEAISNRRIEVARSMFNAPAVKESVEDEKE